MARPRRISRAFLLLIGLQALHSGEEYLTEFYARFPPAVSLDHLQPGAAPLVTPHAARHRWVRPTVMRTSGCVSNASGMLRYGT